MQSCHRISSPETLLDDPAPVSLIRESNLIYLRDAVASHVPETRKMLSVEGARATANARERDVGKEQWPGFEGQLPPSARARA